MSETFIEALRRHAGERPDDIALADDRVRLGWREVAEWVEAAAGWFIERALPRQAPVLGWLPNAAEWYLLRLVCERTGLLWVPVSSSQGSRELTSIAAAVGPAVVATPAHFRGRNYADEADQACHDIGLKPIRIIVPEDTLLRLGQPFTEARSKSSSVDAGRATQPHEGAHILATTGSEGAPKLSLYTLSAAAERAATQAALLRITSKDTILALSTGTGPGKTSWLAAPLAGAAVFTMPVFRPERALEIVEREGTTIVSGTPAQVTRMLPDMQRFDLGTVRLWYMAGSVLPPALARELEERTKGRVLSVYGATDFGGWAAPELDDPPSVRHRTVGRPRGNTEFRIVDRDGRDVVQGEAGELVGRGPCCVSGYYGDPKLTQERWRGGWFQTGDLGRLDADGNLVIIGRTRDLIIRGGDNIAPEEIETLLRTHPAVSQVAVVGLPDPELGERVCACVVAGSGPPPTLEILRDHLSAQGIAHYKLPERLALVSALPIVGDKIDRARLVSTVASHG